MSVDAIIWDYDGTLVNSAPKNMSITRNILAEVAPRLTGGNLPDCLGSEALYHRANHEARNWRELYRDHIGLTEEEADAAGSLWSRHQRTNSTPVRPFDGIIDLIRALAHVPQGVCSQNSSGNIRDVLETERIAPLIRGVVGYEDVPIDRQKPAPEGGVMCLEQMLGEVRNRTVLVVGDHEADVMFARAIADEVGGSNTVVAVAVAWSGSQPERWEHQPDRVIARPRELATLEAG